VYVRKSYRFPCHRGQAEARRTCRASFVFRASLCVLHLPVYTTQAFSSPEDARMKRFNAGNVRLARESARWATLLGILLLVPGLAASSARAEESVVLRAGLQIQSSVKAGAGGEQISRTWLYVARRWTG